MEPKFQVQLKIGKPVAEVFDAVVNPDKLTRYFIQSTNGPLVEGVTVRWKFAEVPEAIDVVVREVRPSERIVFEWPAEDGDYRTCVEMTFLAVEDESTLVLIKESGWRPNPTGIEASYGNAGGWMHMMCCLKAYLEFGINLRTGGVCGAETA
ncbi:SRPBCC domain-containing protein [Filomicrobium sp.]|uniref:SRPBCC domain-containing protein n=1 Tax=Filomicrobium sp. TaxID=2024831 RepID=UPI002588FA0D|nr:SRPBCC domain-containing protein [Filomicrobium sp.]MCV0370475.1 SRPBCC domain-containing protein [Filomicrobium sp.]